MALVGSGIYRLATGWTVRRSNPGRGEIFRTRPDQPWSPPSLLYKAYRVSFLGVKRPGLGVVHTPLLSSKVKGRVELYVLLPPLGLRGLFWGIFTFTSGMCLFFYRVKTE